LVAELSKQPSLGTDLDKVVLPSIRAAIDLNQRNPTAAIEELQIAALYDLSTASGGVTLYYRGLAYLQLKSGKEAAAQFQKILGNCGVVAVDIHWPLARLGLARAYAMTKDTDRSAAQYREILTFWQHADPDLRLFNEAQAEYKRISGEHSPPLQ
jgi:tetratricopeptide (TPR) repeat protein